MRQMKRATVLLVIAMIAMPVTATAEVLYRQTFPAQKGGSAVLLSEYGWQAYVRGSAEDGTYAVADSTSVAMAGPTANQTTAMELKNVSARAPEGANGPGRAFVQTNAGGIGLVITGVEDSPAIDPARHKSLSFLFMLRNDTRKNRIPVRLAVRIANQWFVTSAPVGDEGGWSVTTAADPEAFDRYEYAFSRDAKQWRHLVNPGGGREPKIGERVLTELPAGPILQFGLLFQSVAAAHRFDDVTWEADQE
jgi:hypothetical protein